MTVPEHTIEPRSAGGIFVRVCGKLAGIVSEDGEYIGLWGAWTQNGQFLCYAASQTEAVAFLVSRVREEDESRL